MSFSYNINNLNILAIMISSTTTMSMTYDYRITTNMAIHQLQVPVRV